MRLEDISFDLRAQTAKYLWDRIIEKHEGPADWRDLVDDDYDDFLEFIKVGAFDVLLPIDKARHANIRIDRCLPSSDGTVLTIFLTDNTYDTGLFAGYMAVCEKVPGQDWFLAFVYHECWVNGLAARS